MRLAIKGGLHFLFLYFIERYRWHSEANFHFWGPRLFQIGVLLEGLGQLMSYKLAPHLLVTFTEQVVPIHKHISYFIINSLVIRNKDSHNETNEKASGEVIWPHTHCIFIEYLTGLVKSERMDSGVLFQTLNVTITNSQLHEKGMLIVIHFNPSRSFLYISGSQTFSDRVPFVCPLPSSHTTLFQEKLMCQISFDQKSRKPELTQMQREQNGCEKF